MGRITLAVDDALVEQAKVVLGTHTKRATIDAALREVVRRARLRKIEEHCGAVDLGFSRDEVLERREQS